GEDLLFLESYKSSLRLANGKTIEFRPMLPSDEFSSRNFFYSLKEETIYNRYFSRIQNFTHELMQKQWARIDYRNNMSILGLVQRGGHKEIMAIGSYVRMNDTMAEVAFVVREDFQGMGIGSYLLQTLEGIARQNGISAFWATLLRENKIMERVFRKRYPRAGIVYDCGETYITMAFDQTAAEG
ncbi:MAG: GNAT family N-acetyltransferase, partial [Thermodesulfobacteriota bacterium]